MLSNKLLVGRILKPLGINGLVKIQSYMTKANDFLQYQTFYAKNDMHIEIIKLHFIGGDKFSGLIRKNDTDIFDTNELQEFRLTDLYLYKNSLPALSKNEYYFEDLKGLVVRNSNNINIGKIRAVFDYGAGTFLELILDSGKLATLPFNKYSVINITTDVTINEHYLLF